MLIPLHHEQKEPSFKFGTKAETLTQLKHRQRRFLIPEFMVFTAEQWADDAKGWLEVINRTFSDDCKIIVRSSTLAEDSAQGSMAGAFESIADIPANDNKKLIESIEAVLDSFDDTPGNQVLVQRMAEDIVASGVITTHNLDDGSPYYVLNYDDESGRTDSITSGTGVHKTVYVYRRLDEANFDSLRVVQMVNLARELENLIDKTPMDIEFGLDSNNHIYLFQVRRLCTPDKWRNEVQRQVNRTLPHVESFVDKALGPTPGIAGSQSILSNMADWNPAEIIGATPRPLAASLYRHIITSDVWAKARGDMGYHSVPSSDLMLLIGGRPFIDVRLSFNSFLPEGLPAPAADKLVNAWIKRLNDYPELHDKVEFEIAHTVYDFTFEQDFNARYDGVLSAEEFSDFKDRLHRLTKANVTTGPTTSLSMALEKIESLRKRQEERRHPTQSTSAHGLVQWIRHLLSECREFGTRPFSVIARHAFMAESLLKSAGRLDALTPERLREFKLSLSTVMSDFARDLQAVRTGTMDEQDLIRQYGHLRPGTYDIMSPCYAARDDILTNACSETLHKDKAAFKLTKEETDALNKLLSQSELGVSTADELMEYAKTAIIGREYAKFIFTRNLSESIELLAYWGTLFGLDRHDVSNLDISDIIDTIHTSYHEDTEGHLHKLIQKGMSRLDQARALKLSYIIRSPRDLYVVPVHRSKANFVTSGQAEGRVILLSADSQPQFSLNDAIVCIENADPGFDWIFTRDIKGLITKYGGINSHMTIRAAELGIPAAVGCGEQLFNMVSSAKAIRLDCGGGTICPL